ncbi:MAG: anti-sigma F factor [Lachnospiraceae bacterium]|nr:anti-sigma F factor [Lachnospiraceae bacterium]
MNNEMRVEFDAKSVNEGFARVAVAAFLTQLNPTLDEVADVKTAVSEAVTNAIIHGYENKEGKVFVSCRLQGKEVWIAVEDKGVGMEDVQKAMEPFYTTKPEQERSGMGFAFMEAFMDEMQVESKVGYGTTVTMKKKIGQKEEENQNGCGDSFN